MPYWIYSLYFLLLLLAVRRCFAWQLPITLVPFFITMLALLAWSHAKLADMIYMHGLLLWVSGACIGLLPNLLSSQKSGIKADKRRWRIALPASYRLLILTFLLFSLEYSIYLLAVTPDPLLQAKIFKVILLFTLGWSAGATIGWQLQQVYRFLRAEHTDLPKK